MARAGSPRGLIQRLVEEGGSATATLKSYREAGGKIANQTWYRMFGEAQNEQALGGIEEGKPLHLRPTSDEILQMSTVRATGYLQRVQVIGKNQEGEVFTITRDLKTTNLMSRKRAIERAIEDVENIPDVTRREHGSLPVSVVTAFYGGTYELSPTE